MKYASVHRYDNAIVRAKVITVRPLSEDGLYTGSQRTLQISKSNGRLVRAIRNDGKSQADPFKVML